MTIGCIAMTESWLFYIIQPSLLPATCVLWSSFSPDGTRFATCTSDGFIKLWNVDTTQIYQRFKSSRETSSAACWWSEKYLLICNVIGKIPTLSRYPVDGSSKIIVNERQSLPLCSINDAFLPFSGFLDFSEGYLSFECGRTEPVKVLDVTEVGHPKKVILPGIKPMMSIAVSPRASFVLAVAVGGYFLWKRDESHPTVYYVFVDLDPSLKTPFEGNNHFLLVAFGPKYRECCFSNDSKFAVVSSVVMSQPGFLVIDLDTGITFLDGIQDRKLAVSPHEVTKMFCIDTFMIRLIPNMIQIIDLTTWKRLELSFQRHLTRDFVIHSQLSPKGSVLAVPRLTGDMEFLQLRIPRQSSVSDAWTE